MFGRGGENTYLVRANSYSVRANRLNKNFSNGWGLLVFSVLMSLSVFFLSLASKLLCIYKYK